MRYTSSSHSAKYTGDFVFSQLIPYIGNKRKLLSLIGLALESSGLDPVNSTFLDAFSGSTVVSRYAKQLGFAVTANDWEPYAEALAKCFVELNEAPTYFNSRSYRDVLAELNSLAGIEGWITTHLCPSDDEKYDIQRDRMFYMRKNGMRLDAICERIREWELTGALNPLQLAAILGPLLYQACWLSNTSGVFKGFHNGWGGQTGTALYRIKADLELEPAIFFNNGRVNATSRLDASELAAHSQEKPPFDMAYLDPPYNQHPYGSNYHVLNTVTLWDKPKLSPKITGHGDKSAIRHDWRTERRSAYNYQSKAPSEYRKLVSTLNAHFICTSYSTDGFIPLREMIEANRDRGETKAFLQGYKRYRVSSQRFSEKPMNIEFVLLTDTTRSATRSTDSYVNEILEAEHTVISAHAETSAPPTEQGVLF
ncbi:DNA methyltransferase [Granulicella sp. 5B5]|uniref:DNA adenine methylase n=1 Tax=Granulicella sp. 5B5 TaxID=1617967 RepID=UPI0015F6C016|nr:DNA adenine methylase [Granulicella sp. 5B5]QMV17612.1 DNA methyltransferase [Granulicella sp. 5B5]